MGNGTVVVFTAGLDVTADAVIVEMHRRGVPVFRCDPAAFPATLKLGARFSAGWTGYLRSDLRELDLSDVACCWWRRPTPITIAPDTPEPEWVRREAVAGLRGVMAALPWLNHPDDIRAAEHKPVQLANAARVGLTVPQTLITNDPAEARAFARAYGPLVYKPLNGGILDSGRVIYTSPVDPASLDESVAVTAHLFQQQVPKDHELRVTVVDGNVFTARIDTLSERGHRDWRADYSNLRYTADQLPEDVADRVRGLLRLHRLRFAALDFIVTPAGEHVFLEVNPTGSGPGSKRRPDSRSRRPSPMPWKVRPMSERHSAAIVQFVAGLKADGYLTDEAWERTFGSVDRGAFLPAFFTSLPDGTWRAVDATHPDYARLVYADTTLTTQLDGTVAPDPAAPPVSGTGTSSSTQPGLMAVMLDALRLSGDERVLEIGTGTGYNAALLAHRLGEHNVTTVEVDPTVAERARQRLAAAGFQPTVVTGDGQRGWPDGAPYDRLIATVSVPVVPAAWIAQVRDGGVIVTSLWRDLGGGPLLRLEVNAGVAQGFFMREAGGFMPVRSASRATAALATAVKQTGRSRATTVPSGVLHDADAGLWIALEVRNVTWLGLTPDDGHEQMWLFAPDGSWAMVEDTTAQVEQCGPRNLWDEVETAHSRWTGAGGPGRDRLGLTATADGTHRFWLDAPDTVLWEDGLVA